MGAAVQILFSQKNYLGCSCMIFSSMFSRLVVRYESILYTSFFVFFLFHFPLFFVLTPLFPSNFLWVVTSSHWTHSTSFLLQSKFLIIYIYIYIYLICLFIIILFPIDFYLIQWFFVSLLIFLIILIYWYLHLNACYILNHQHSLNVWAYSHINLIFSWFVPIVLQYFECNFPVYFLFLIILAASTSTSSLCMLHSSYRNHTYGYLLVINFYCPPMSTNLFLHSFCFYTLALIYQLKWFCWWIHTVWGQCCRCLWWFTSYHSKHGFFS